MATLERPRRFATREEFLLGSRSDGNGGAVRNGDPPAHRHVRPVRRWTISEAPEFLITYSAGTENSSMPPQDKHTTSMLHITPSPHASPPTLLTALSWQSQL